MTATLNHLNRYIRQDKPVWNAIALTYVIAGYGCGVALLFQANGWLNALGVGLVTHTLFLSAVLTHEFIHSTIFSQQQWNERVGTLMLWINGGCYARFRDLTHWHIAHHAEQADFPPVELTEFLKSLPAFVQRAVVVLEWLYFPAIAYLMQWRALTGPYWNPKRHDERGRTTLILLIRGTLFAALAVFSPKAVLLYFVAYTGMHLVMQFMNAFFHTYESFYTVKATNRDWDYEQANTFSCVLSQRYWRLNLLTLNFGYHNAHHAVMRCPWHSLHELDQDLFPLQKNATSHRFTIGRMVRNYHRYRTIRLFEGHGHVIDDAGNYNLDNFYGDVGVGFMVLPVR